jgi:hypothetical protein
MNFFLLLVHYFFLILSGEIFCALRTVEMQNATDLVIFYLRCVLFSTISSNGNASSLILCMYKIKILNNRCSKCTDVDKWGWTQRLHSIGEDLNPYVM